MHCHDCTRFNPETGTYSCSQQCEQEFVPTLLALAQGGDEEACLLLVQEQAGETPPAI